MYVTKRVWRLSFAAWIAPAFLAVAGRLGGEGVGLPQGGRAPEEVPVARGGNRGRPRQQPRRRDPQEGPRGRAPGRDAGRVRLRSASQLVRLVRKVEERAAVRLR